MYGEGTSIAGEYEVGFGGGGNLVAANETNLNLTTFTCKLQRTSRPRVWLDGIMSYRQHSCSAGPGFYFSHFKLPRISPAHGLLEDFWLQMKPVER